MARRSWSWAAAAALLVAVAAALLLLASPSSAQQPPVSSPSPAAAAPGPGGMDSACMNALLNMSDCLPYVTKGSTARRPDAACCPELAGLVGSDPVCLCELLSGAADSYGIAVDYDRALALPGVCRVATPPVSTCTALGYDVRVGPAAAPMSGSPSPSISPSGEGPQFPGTSPQASPPSPTSTAARRSSSAVGSHLVTLAMLPLAAAAAAAAVSGML